MIYPSVIMFVAVAIVTLLMMVVVPQFQTIFEQMLRGAPLPGPTQIVIGISSDLFSGHPILVLGGMAGTVGGIILFKKTKFGGKIFDWLGLKCSGCSRCCREIKYFKNHSYIRYIDE